MTTTVAPLDRLLDALRAHLASFELPQLCSMGLTLYRPNVSAQLTCSTLPQIAAGLLSWADTLTEPTAHAWRVPTGDSVHLSVSGHLPGAISIKIYGGLPFTPHGIGADLAPNTRTTVALTVLRERAALGEVTH